MLKPGATAPEETRHLYDVDDITGDFAVGDDGRTQLARMYVTPMLDDNLSFSQYGDLGREYYYYTARVLKL